jgi:hypothetical protein
MLALVDVAVVAVEVVVGHRQPLVWLAPLPHPPPGRPTNFLAAFKELPFHTTP